MTASPTALFAESANKSDHSPDTGNMVSTCAKNAQVQPASVAMPSEGIERTLRAVAAAYPEDVFPEITAEERARLRAQNPDLQDRIAASMGRFLAKHLIAAADEIASFAPILAEKERRIREMAMQALADDQQLTASLDRALAAEPRVSALGQELAQARINLEVAERDEARLLFDTMASTAEEALAQREAAEAERDALREALALYRDAVRIDVQMDGPKFMGSNVSALKRAWEADRALTKETADV